MVKDDGQRTLLYDFDRNILEARQTLGEDHEIVLSLTATYHNLLRQWAEL
jgi:PKHD-type hydroxylase